MDGVAFVTTAVAVSRATRLLQDCRVDTAPVSVEDIAAQLDVQIVHEKLDATISGLLLREGQARLIAVNNQHHPRRRRFTIAHELGHLLLHKGQYIVDSTVRVNLRDALSSMATDQEEIEANAFAAELLMPASLIKQALGAMRVPESRSPARLTSQLAEAFGVSTEAMGYRLINLGITT